MISLTFLLVLGSITTVVDLQTPQPKLIFVQSILRHGAKNPFQILGIGDEYAKEEQSLGQLTTQGKAMHYHLGKKMYQVYWKRLFGGTEYEHSYHPSRFFVESTSTSRTIESAQAHMYGILEKTKPLYINSSQVPYSRPPSYPNTNAVEGFLYGKEGVHVHPTPVHIYARNMSAFDTGDFLTRFLQWQCPNQEKWQKQNFLNTQYEEMLNDKDYLKALKELSRGVGKPIQAKNFTLSYHNLQCMQYRGMKVPQVFAQPSPTKRAMDSFYALLYYIKYYSGRKQIRASATDLFEATINNFNRAITNLAKSPQWVIYSSHDATIGIGLAIMEMWSAECIYEGFKSGVNNSDSCVLQFPPFASSLVFQLYEYPNGKHTIKVNYNGIHRKIPFCGNEDYCDFDRFKSWFDGWKVQDVRAACGAPNYYTKFTLSLLISAIIGSILFWMVVRLIKGKGQDQVKKQ